MYNSRQATLFPVSDTHTLTQCQFFSCAGSSVEERGEEENGEGEDDVGGRPREDSQVGGELVVWWVWSRHGNMFPVATRTQETDAEAAQPESEVGQDEDEVKLLQLTFIVQYSPTIITAVT